MKQGRRQSGVVVLAPLILLLTAVIIFTHSSSERFIRLQQRQSTQVALMAAYANAQNTLRHILAIMRTTPVAQLTDQLAFANTRIVSEDIITTDGRDITGFRFAFDEPVQRGTRSRTIYAEAIRYSALMYLPDSSFFAATRLPADTRLTVWHSTDLPTIAANAPPTLPADNMLYCRQNRIPQCTAYPGENLSPPANDIVAQLFNRPQTQLNADNFIETIRSERCDNLSVTRASAIWVTGDCHLSVNQSLGTRADPVLLVIENGDLRLASAAGITGLVLIIRRNSALPSAIRMASSAFVTGALITTAPLDDAAQIQLIADDAPLLTLQRAHALAKITLIPGSWRDFD